MTSDPAATAALYAQHVLKDGDSFVVANGYGDIEHGTHGLFHDDTRLLSTCRLLVGGIRPSLLSAGVTRDNVFFVAHLTNQELPPLGGVPLTQGLLHLNRSRLLCHERVFERIACRNYGHVALPVVLRLELAADFRDMFEVRGIEREVRGDLLPAQRLERGLAFAYRGLDGVLRRSVVQASVAPARFADDALEFEVLLPPGAGTELYLEVGTEPAPDPGRQRFRDAAANARWRMRTRQRRGARLRSGAPLFQDWLQRSRSDLALLTSELDTGPYPYAGIPWFSTPFGRDAVITSLQMLWLNTQLPRGVLSFLAKHQAHEESKFLDAEPGKIMHETRKGEMSALRELPFGRYYGGVDTTPLFVVLAGAYARRTGDLAFIDALWPSLLAATAWIERTCDANPDGLLDYARGADTGLANQGWKDSEDSVFHADGSFPPGPVALVEVQGYAFAAFRAMATLAAHRKDGARMAHWNRRAGQLREAVERCFWMPEEGFYGIAVDGERRLCRVLATNPGHLLYVGLPLPERGRQVASRLMAADFHTGWGLRTLAKGQPRYNPMSYHNGSVWPHDTALCAAGIARQGERADAVRLLRGAFEAAVHFDMRVPELFCGFSHVASATPVAYPVACLPQAWAAGSAFMLLQACLGVDVDGWQRAVRVDQPQLPAGVDEVRLNRLQVGASSVDLVFRRFGAHVGAFLEGPGAGDVRLQVTR